MNKKIKQISYFLGTRIFVLMAIAGFIFLKVTHYEDAIHLAQLRTLNRLLPPLKPLIDFNRGQGEVERALFEKYELYYRSVNEYLPPSPDAYDLLGYISAGLEQPEEAIAYYQKSIELNPYFFWSHYNLGVLYLHQRQFQNASEEFKAALQIPPEAAVAVFSKSKIYQQFFVQMDHPVQQIQQGLTIGYKDCYRLFALSSQLAQSPNPPTLSFDWQNAPLFIF